MTPPNTPPTMMPTGVGAARLIAPEVGTTRERRHAGREGKGEEEDSGVKRQTFRDGKDERDWHACSGCRSLSEFWCENRTFSAERRRRDTSDALITVPPTPPGSKSGTMSESLPSELETTAAASAGAGVPGVAVGAGAATCAGVPPSASTRRRALGS